ncbi:pyridoxal-phosphate dependent enzyme [Prosthecochloris sp. SCSIO W1103]|uniref:pyridoxal-phosphate dependent enzyme n=1 Tax=Prosthecochloris sp. SCSIO W1103 TaxID=2992244 RepID=UPI00223DABCE|nr:pyridoxal-phosphate dependent enzyme [Prosthecochloris sp. SCSIO W1103]UZJ38336.1 pyridoxal-phosphate dependent enzyme [Prosthecochloris sp. SCSIO W1103]
MQFIQNKPFQSALHALLRPTLYSLGKNLYGVSFDTMKIIPSYHIVRQAHATGQLGENAPIIETTSGTMGKGLAYVCHALGIPLILVSDPVFGTSLQNELCSLDCRVEIVETSPDSASVQQLRLERVHELLKQYPGSYWARQYDNPWNPESYGSVAAQIVDEIGVADCLVATVGSGGSSVGTARYLRKLFPGLNLIGVDTHGSKIFGQPLQTRIFRGLGNSVIPGNVDHEAFDEIHWMDAREGYKATRHLHRIHGLFKGPTSGAAYWVARWYTAHHPDETVIALLPDNGYRYASSVYSDAWLLSNNLYLDQMSKEPDTVSFPAERTQGWTRLEWARRSLKEIITSDTTKETQR